LVGYHSPAGTNADHTPDEIISGGSATLFLSDRNVATDANSTDGTYGTTAIPGSPTTSNAAGVRIASDANDSVTLKFVNNTGQPYNLETLHFDYGRWFDNSPKDVTASAVFGDLTGGSGQDPNPTQLMSATGLATTGKIGDHHDFDVDLTQLTESTLADGEQQNFELVVSNANGDFANGSFDNIALSGSVVPTPSAMSAGLVLLGGMTLVGRRRRA
jgi:hypothetical protein